MLHGIHAIFPPTAVTQYCGYDPISEGQLKKGKGKWSLEKRILGWDVDGQARIIQLPPDKYQNNYHLVRKVIKRQCVSLQKFQQLTGKLQPASFGIPGGKSLLTPLNMAMTSINYFEIITSFLKYLRLIGVLWYTTSHKIQHHAPS